VRIDNRPKYYSSAVDHYKKTDYKAEAIASTSPGSTRKADLQTRIIRDLAQFLSLSDTDKDEEVIYREYNNKGNSTRHWGSEGRPDD